MRQKAEAIAVEETEVVDGSSPANRNRREFPADKVRHLARHLPETNDVSAPGQAGEPQSKILEDRAPEAEPSARPPVLPGKTASRRARSAKSLRRPLLF